MLNHEGILLELSKYEKANIVLSLFYEVKFPEKVISELL